MATLSMPECLKMYCGPVLHIIFNISLNLVQIQLNLYLLCTNVDECCPCFDSGTLSPVVLMGACAHGLPPLCLMLALLEEIWWFEDANATR